MSGSGPQHPLQGVGHSHRPAPTPFDHLSRVAALSPSAVAVSPSSLNDLISPSNAPPNPYSSNRSASVSGGDADMSPPDLAARPTKKQRRSTGQGPSPEGDHDEGNSARKRAKQTLSCSECKRRKIKCDRTQPCSACVKRGSPHECSWEDAKIEPERQPFALADDVDELRDRLVLLERFINKLPPTLRAQNFAELGITSMGPLARQPPDDALGAGGQMFEDLDKLEGKLGVETSCLSAPGYNPGRAPPQDNLELLENALMIVTQQADRDARPEYTDALTSIVAPRPVFTDPFSATKLGLDLCFTESDFLAERHRVLDSIFRFFPDKETSYAALRSYEQGFAWIFNIIHMPTLYAEHKRYWEMVEAGRRDEVDPAWLANYALILALSRDKSTHLRPVSEISESNPALEQESLALYAAAQRLILLADPYGRPQIRIVYFTFLISCWTIAAALDSSDWSRFTLWLALATRTCHALGLHRLTDDPENMPPDDPAWPPGKNSVKREGALRLWSLMTFYDHLAAPSRFSTYMIQPAHTTTPILSNIDSRQLSMTDWKIEAQPDTVVTDATFERLKYKLSQISRKTFDIFVTGSRTFNYGSILEMDREYRMILDEMPDAWSQEHSSREEKDVYLKAIRNAALQSIHNRIVRLHRPFLARGWTPGSKFAYSTNACVRSARVILVCHHNNVGFAIKPMFSHSLSASIVLAADLFHHIDAGSTAAEIEGKKENLALALEIFSVETERRVRSKHLKAIVGQARRVLSGLFLEVEKRRARRMAFAASGKSPEAGAKEEPFADVLARITRELPAAAPPTNQRPVGQVDPNAYSSSSTAPYAQGGDPYGSHPAVPSTSSAPQGPHATSAFPGMTNPSSNGSSSILEFGPNGAGGALPGLGGLPTGGGAGADVGTNSSDPFSAAFLSDLGLLDFNGQPIDYYGNSSSNASTSTYPSYGVVGQSHHHNGHGHGAGSSSGSTTSSIQGGPSPSDSFDLSFLGVNGAVGAGQDATQALFNQLTGGW
ncbi:hypothetical protein JCM10212_003160 [Sporobolomyces blumeae]